MPNASLCFPIIRVVNVAAWGNNASRHPAPAFIKYRKYIVFYSSFIEELRILQT